MVVVNDGDSGRRRRWRQGARGEGDTVDGGQGREGKGEASEGERAMVDMAGDNGKQQERVSDVGAARRHSSKINKIGMTIPTCFLMLVCAHLHPKKTGSTRDSAKDR